MGDAPTFYRARLVKGGPYVGVKVWHGQPLVGGELLDRSPRWQCLVGAEDEARAVLMGDALPIEVDGVTLRNLEPIGPADHAYYVAHGRWAEAGGDHIRATPRVAFAPRNSKSLF